MTYLGYAIHLELKRRELEAAYGPDVAQLAIVKALADFKAARQAVKP